MKVGVVRLHGYEVTLFFEESRLYFDTGRDCDERSIAFLLVLVMAMMWTAAALGDGLTYRNSVCQREQHVALNVQNASGEPAIRISIVNAFLAEEVDLIVAHDHVKIQRAFAPLLKSVHAPAASNQCTIHTPAGDPQRIHRCIDDTDMLH